MLPREEILNHMNKEIAKTKSGTKHLNPENASIINSTYQSQNQPHLFSMYEVNMSHGSEDDQINHTAQKRE